MAMHPGTDMERVRHVLARELETISEYEVLAREAQDPHVRAFLAHLAAEEKEHVAEAVAVLRQLDPDQEAFFVRGVPDDHFAPTAQGAAPRTTPFVPSPPSTTDGALDATRRAGGPDRALTVGSLEPSAPAALSAPSRAVHAEPAPPAGHAIPFTVGSLRPRR